MKTIEEKAIEAFYEGNYRAVISLLGMEGKVVIEPQDQALLRFMFGEEWQKIFGLDNAVCSEA